MTKKLIVRIAIVVCLLAAILPCQGVSPIYGGGGGAGGGSPGGSTGDLQTNAGGGTFGGVTPGTGILTALGINIGSAGAPVLFNGAGGTPTSLVGTNISGTAASLTAGNATKWTTGRTVSLTGDVTATTGSLDGSGNATAAATVANVPVTAAHPVDNTVVPTDTGGWSEYAVAGSDFTTSSASLVDVTGMISGALSSGATYEFDVVLRYTGGADAAGMKIGLHPGGSSGSPTLFSNILANNTSATAAAVSSMNAIDTSTATLMAYASAEGIILCHGFFVARTTSPTFSVQVLKVTSGTCTIRIGSTLRIKKK